MTDVGKTIEAKSTQVNADDLLGGPLTILITAVKANTSSSEQPIAISFEGDGGKFYYPCKTIRRLLVALWGADGNKYVGRHLRLYRDPDVTWAGIKVGGLRVSHMSHIDKTATVVLQQSKGNKKPITVHPLEIKEDRQQTQSEPTPIDIYGKELKSALGESVEDFEKWWVQTAKRRDELNIPEERLANMHSAANAKLDGRSDESQ